MNKQYDPKIGWGPEPSLKEYAAAQEPGRIAVNTRTGESMRTGLGAEAPDMRAPTFSAVRTRLESVAQSAADLCRRSRELAQRMTGCEPVGPLPDYMRHDSIPGAHMALVDELSIMLGQLDGDLRRIERGLGLTEEF